MAAVAPGGDRKQKAALSNNGHRRVETFVPNPRRSVLSHPLEICSRVSSQPITRIGPDTSSLGFFLMFHRQT